MARVPKVMTSSRRIMSEFQPPGTASANPPTPVSVDINVSDGLRSSIYAGIFEGLPV
jgi:hypothetical protein